MYDSIPWDLLITYFKKEANPEDIKNIRDWQNASDANSKIFIELQQIWKISQNTPQFEPEIKQAWEKVFAEIKPSPDKERNLTSFNFYSLLKVAAIFIVAFGLSFFLLRFMMNGPQNKQLIFNEMKVPLGSKSQILLSDGSKIWLNSGSHLKYPAHFEQGSREIFLEGEAFFDVSKNPEQPFIVHTSQINVKVLGTSFNLKAYPDEETFEATVVSGEVKVYKNDNAKMKIEQPVLLKPNQRIKLFTKEKVKEPLNKTIRQISPVKPILEAKVNLKVNTELYTAWKDGKLMFENMDFGSLAKEMEKWYDVKIMIKNEEISKYKYTGVFKNETIEQALKALQMISNFDFTIDKNIIIINKNK